MGRSMTNLVDGLSASDLSNIHWSLPRSKSSPHRHKVLTNGSIMQNGGGGGGGGGGSQGLIGGLVGGASNAVGGVAGSANSGGVAIADGTSISSKPSVSSDDTGIEVNDHHGAEADSRDSADTAEHFDHRTAVIDAALALTPMLLPPPGFGTVQPQYGNQVRAYFIHSFTINDSIILIRISTILQHVFQLISLQNHNGYMAMYPYSHINSSHSMVAPLPVPSPGSQDARVVRIANAANDYHPRDSFDSPQSWMTEFNDVNYSQPSSRRPLVVGSFSAGSFRESTGSSADSHAHFHVQQQHFNQQHQLQPPSTPTSLTAPKKKRHISFV